MFLPELIAPIRRIGSAEVDFRSHVVVMAVVNRTPDSFYDPGRTFALDAAVDAVLAAERDGADWVDIGGQPFAPGREVAVEDEIARVVPVIVAVRERSRIPISAETYRARVAEACIAAGANVVNDTSGLFDADLARVVADAGVQLVITHSLAAPRRELGHAPQYDDVVGEVRGFLAKRIDAAVASGVDADQLIVDPGHDLNKNTLHSLALTREFRRIADLGLPALAAVSNKDFVGETLGRERQERVAGSLAAEVICILQGARIVRMHNVRPAVDAARMTEAVFGMRQPVELRHNR